MLPLRMTDDPNPDLGFGRKDKRRRPGRRGDRRHRLTCAHCGDDFRSHREGARFCTPECRTEFHEARREREVAEGKVQS